MDTKKVANAALLIQLQKGFANAKLELLPSEVLSATRRNATEVVQSLARVLHMAQPVVIGHKRFVRAEPGAGTWNDTGDAGGVGMDTGNANSILPFYASGADAEFAMLNGAYQPTIAIEVTLP